MLAFGFIVLRGEEFQRHDESARRLGKESRNDPNLTNAVTRLYNGYREQANVTFELLRSAHRGARARDLTVQPVE